MLAALLLRQRGMEVTILDQRPQGSPKAQLAGAAGIQYVDDHNTPVEKMSPPGGYHWIIEATGYSPLLFRAANLLSRNGVLVLTGVTSGHHTLTVDSDHVNSTLVLENQTIVGSVNAARHHYLAAAADLMDWADRWPGLTQQLITAKYPLDQFAQAYQKSADGIKSVVVIDKGGQE
jgi:threonine dehydrogenase-like Zn-dependent dehydrogenase